VPIGRGYDALQAALRVPPAAPVSRARARLREEAAALARRERLVQAAWSYRIAALEAPAGPWLRAGGQSLFAPRLLPESGTLTAIACAVCTIGPALERRVRALFDERRASLAVALDELGNEALSAASRALQDRMLVDATRHGRTMAGELRPGDPGLDAGAQQAVTRIAQAARIGCEVSPGGLLVPLKSTSMVLGVGIGLPIARWSRCDECPTRSRCRILAQRGAEALAA
jgi:hypothetical protein